MPILYSPDGQSISISNGRVGDYLRQGYSSIRPSTNVEGEPIATHLPPPLVPPELKAHASLTGDLNLNTATLKELQKLPGSSTDLARRIRDGRPYERVEDLIQKVPEINWLALRNRVNVNPAEDSKESENSEDTTKSETQNQEALGDGEGGVTGDASN